MLAAQTTDLVGKQFASGASNTLQIAQAQAQQATIAETLSPLRTREASLINAIGLLLALPPRALADELRAPASQPSVPPLVPVGLAGDLVRRRPDIREAEARLHAATAQTGVAVADFFPQVSLNGAFGTQSLSTSNLFDWSSRMFMGGPSITVPLFEGGRLKGQLDLRKAEQREAALAYRQTVLQAWHDVDNALTAYAETQHRRGEILFNLNSNRTALAAAEERYAQGTVDFLNVISAQEAVLQSQDNLVQVDAELDGDLVALYRALGGGWSAVDAMAPAYTKATRLQSKT